MSLTIHRTGALFSGRLAAAPVTHSIHVRSFSSLRSFRSVTSVTSITRGTGNGTEDTAGDAASPQGADSEADDIKIEQMMASKRKSKKGQAPEPAKPYKVVSATRDSVYGDQPPSQIQQVETTVVQGLGLLFVLILAEGIFLGASGFMSAEMDQLAQDVVYPLFTPTLGVFLAGSTAYGLWKTKEDDSAKN